MSDSSYVGDYFYTDEESLKHMHELERQRVTRLSLEVWPVPASYSSHTVA